MDPGDLLRQTAQDGGGLLDTSATLADWIMRSTGSSAGVSQRESDEAAEAVAELVAASADVAYSSLLLESLSKRAAKPGSGGSRRDCPGMHSPQQRLPRMQKLQCQRARQCGAGAYTATYPLVSLPVTCTKAPCRCQNAWRHRQISAAIEERFQDICLMQSTSLAGPFPSHKSPVSFPVALSESASLSRATPSPERPRRVSHTGRPSAALAPLASDTEDTADSGSSQDQRQSSDSSGLQHGMGISQQGGTGARRQQTPGPAGSGSTESTVDSAARPRHRVSQGKSGAGLYGPGPRPYREITTAAQSRSPEAPSGRAMEPGAAHPAKPQAGESHLVQPDGGQEACSGRDELAAQVPALQKLKLRVRSRHRTSSQGGELPLALQALELTDRQLPLAAEAAPRKASASAQLLVPERGTDRQMQNDRKAAAGQPRSTITGTDTVPAEEQLVFRASRTLPRSPLKGSPQPSAQNPLTMPPLAPTMVDAVSDCDDPPHMVSSPSEQAQPQCRAHSGMPGARSSEVGTGEACTDSSRSQQRSTTTLDLTPSPQQQPESPPGSLMFPAVSKAQRSSTAEASAIFTPSHKLARSPPRQPDLLVTPRKDSSSRLGPCSFPQGLEAEQLPETPRMRAAAQDLPERHAGTCSGTQSNDSPAHREDYR